MRTRRHLLKSLAAALALPAAAQPRRPNLVFVFCDQLRAMEIGCMGNPHVRTPNLDRLAADGILMRNNYSCAPVCSPFRGQLMTGRYPWRNGVIRNGAEINAESKTIAEVLGENAYKTGFIGKWHLYRQEGTAKDAPDSEFVPPRHRRGWQFWAATNNGQHAGNAIVYRDSPKPVSIPGTEIEWQTRTAIEFLEQNKSNRFCLMIAWNPPHVPLTPTIEAARYNDADIPVRPNVPQKYQEETRRAIARYAATVTVIDDSIGRLTAALDRLGLARDTVFAFTSDHGLMLNSHGQTDKQRPWEESAHTPYIVRYPRAIPAGRSSDAMVSSVDLMPTMLGLLGVRAPGNVDGVDVSPLMRGQPGKEPESVYLSQRSFGGGPGFDWQGVVTKEWKYVRHPGGHWLLYHRGNDPYELTNLAFSPEHAPTLARLAALTDSWRDRTGDAAPLRASLRPPERGALASPDAPEGERNRDARRAGKKKGKK